MKGSWPQTIGSQRQETLVKRAGEGNLPRLPRNREWGLLSPPGGPTQCGGETPSSPHMGVFSWSCPDLPGPWQGASGNPKHRGHEALYFLSLRRGYPHGAKVCVYGEPSSSQRRSCRSAWTVGAPTWLPPPAYLGLHVPHAPSCPGMPGPASPWPTPTTPS